MNALDAIRELTGAMHRQLDSGMPLSKTSLDAADYAAHLALMEAWLEATARLPLERIDHPVSAQRITVDAPLPQDCDNALKWIP